MIKRLLILLLLLFSSLLSRAQSGTSIEDLFRLQLFLDKQNWERYTEGVIKNDSLYQAFKESTQLNIDTLRVISKFDFPPLEQFRYFQIDLRKKGMTQKKKLTELSAIQSLGFSAGFESVFILCINMETGVIYRLRGFNGNDFFSYLRDFAEVYNTYTGHYRRMKKISNRKFFKNYQVSGLDFKCLYKGLISKKKFQNKYQYSNEYPCLRKCSEPTIIGSR